MLENSLTTSGSRCTHYGQRRTLPSMIWCKEFRFVMVSPCRERWMIFDGCTIHCASSPAKRYDYQSTNYFVDIVKFGSRWWSLDLMLVCFAPQFSGGCGSPHWWRRLKWIVISPVVRIIPLERKEKSETGQLLMWSSCLVIPHEH